MTLEWRLRVIRHPSKRTDWATPSAPSCQLWTRVIVTVSVGLSAVTTPTLVGELIPGDAVHVGAGDIWEISVPSAQFCCELKLL